MSRPVGRVRSLAGVLHTRTGRRIAHRSRLHLGERVVCDSHAVTSNREGLISLIFSSDVLHWESRAELLGTLKFTTKNARFRQHDELRYSLRSAFKNTKSWKHSVWHIVTADVPDPDEFDDSQRLGLVPQWLDLESAWAGGENGEPPVYLYHGTSPVHPLLGFFSNLENQTARSFI